MSERADAVVFQSRSRARCDELWAVLDAAGIPAQLAQPSAGAFLVLVRGQDAERATAELKEYLREVQPAVAPPPLPLLGGGRLGILLYAATLVTVAALAERHAFGADWFDGGRGQAGLLLRGQWWRALTALTLHVDARHLLGNLFFGSVLGFLAAQRLGGGVAWLMILGGGALGNLANALLRDSAHTAVGASTAVFAALGLLVALGLYHRRSRTGNVVQRLSPLFAGILLLAWTGIGGERTDVLAHVTGLVAGLLLGAASGAIPLGVLERRSVQCGAAALVLLVLASAWVSGLR